LVTTVTDVAPLCGLTTSLVATTTPTNLQTGQWTASPATGVVFTNPTAPNTSVTVPGTGLYTFTWTTGNGVCTASDNTAVDFSTPIVGASATPEDQALYINKTTKATASVTSPSVGVTYTWTVISGTPNSVNPANVAEPIFSPIVDSEYEVTIRSGNSCVERRRIRIRVISEIYVPNVFTPNGDGLYDTWIIRELDGFLNASVKVFNRWGDLIFENKGAYTKPWDGTYNGKPVGTATFYYVIDKGENVPAPDKREIKGSVTVTY
jgi:gliding motility-associated-like protein